MKSINSHAFSTWILAHGLHVVILIIGGVIFNGELFELAGVIAVFAFLASIPAIVAFWTAISVIINSSLSPLAKLFIWILVALFIVGANAWLLMFGLSAGSLNESLVITMGLGGPSIIATLLAILIRSQQFLWLNKYIMEQKIKELS